MEIPGVNKKEVEFPEGWPINSINVFQGKIQTVQFTNIYSFKHSIFTWYDYDNHDNEN